MSPAIPLFYGGQDFDPAFDILVDARCKRCRTENWFASQTGFFMRASKLGDLQKRRLYNTRAGTGFCTLTASSLERLFPKL